MSTVMRTTGKILLVVVLLAGLVYLYYTEVKPTVIFGLRTDYAHAIPYQKVPTGLQSLKAESCGTCHREIYEEWKTSIHAQAYTDPFFHAYWTRDKHTWVCLNCHAPLENQQPTLITQVPRGRVEKASQDANPHYDPAYQKEGVTCAACHVREGTILGPFEDSVAPHATKFDPDFRTTQICYRCHNVIAGTWQFYKVGPCGTYAEAEGGYFLKDRGFVCQSCHMPEVERPMADGGPIRQGRRHLWRGGHDPDMVRRAIAFQIEATPAVPKPGEKVEVTLTLINAGAGHKLPTGDPDRHFTVEFLVHDKDGKILESQQNTMGRWILWQPAIVELYDNRLLPLASRNYTFTYHLPRQIDGLHLTARVQYHIQTEGQHAMLKKKYGLTSQEAYFYTVYERDVPLSGDLNASLGQGSHETGSSCQVQG